MFYFRFDNDIYLVTELCLFDLQTAIKLRQKSGLYFTEEEIRQALAQILQALLVIHSFSIMHRDLKPQNIFVRSVEPIELCLADFDVSIDLSIGLEERGNYQISSDNFAGTRGFLSSDMIGQIIKDYSFPLEIQVLGIVAFRLCNLFTGRQRI